MAALAVLLAWSANAWAGPWTRSLGDVYVQAGERLFLADSFVDPSGQLVSDVAYLGASSYFYAEVGLASRFHLTTYLPFSVAVNSFDDGFSYMRGGFGDAGLGLQWQPLESLLLAVRAEVKLPLYDLEAYSGPFAQSFPALGSGNVDGTVWLSYGGSPAGTSMFLFGELGYRLRTGVYPGGEPAGAPDFADGVALAAELGGAIWEHLTLSIAVRGIVPFADDGVTEGYLVVSEGLFAPVDGGWALVGSVDQTVWARNSARGFGFSLGVAFSL